MAASAAPAPTAEHECKRPVVPCTHTDACTHCQWERCAPPGTSCVPCLGERLSRATCVLAALQRLHGSVWLDAATLHLALVGVDFKEGTSPAAFLGVHVAPLLAWLAAHSAVRCLQLHAVGPGLAWASGDSNWLASVEGARSGASTATITLSEQGIESPSPSSACTAVLPPVEVGGDGNKFRSAAAPAAGPVDISVHLHSSDAMWEAYSQPWCASLVAPDPREGAAVGLVFAPNAGMWGYDSWLPGMTCMLQDVPVAPDMPYAVLVSSYALSEGEEDEEALRSAATAAGAALSFHWEAQPCPGGGGHVADAKYGVVNNAVWQCFSPASAPS